MEQQMEEDSLDQKRLYEAIIAGDVQELKRFKRREWFTLTVSDQVTCMDGRFLEMCQPLSPGKLDLLSKGCCDCVADQNGGTIKVAVSLLHVAVHSERPFDVIDYLVQTGSDVNAQTSYAKRSILYGLLSATCDEQQKLNILKFIIGHGFEVLQRDAKGGTLVHACVFHKQVNLLSYLLETTNLRTLLNACDNRGVTPLLLAARSRHSIAHYLLTFPEIDVNIADRYNTTPLFIAIEARMHALTDRLLELGADVNQQPLKGRIVCTPLLLAVEQSDAYLVEKLLKKGADANKLSPLDPTPALMIACYRKSVPIAKLLIEYKADVNLTNDKGYAPLHIAAWNGYEELVDLFVSSRAEFDIRTADGNTPFSLACHGNKLAIVRYLLPFGVFVNNSDKDMDMPLHYATYNGCFESIKALCEHGAEPDAANQFNTTPLWNAAYKGYTNIVRYLLRYNPDLDIESVGIQQDADNDAVTKCFTTPRSVLYVAGLAAHRGNKEVVEVLLAAGARVWKEKWIYEEQSGWFLKTVHKHLSLLSLCRAAVRDRLRGQGNFTQEVNRLEIPYTLKAYLTTESLYR